MTPPYGGVADSLLTRTTLQMDESLSAPSVGHAVHALQHVPGVLLAEFNAADARAIVAHDSAVSVASLLAAAAGAGARATVVVERPAVTAVAGTSRPFASMPMRRLVLYMAALVLVQGTFGAVSPSLPKMPLLVPLLATFVWAFVLFVTISKQST